MYITNLMHEQCRNITVKSRGKKLYPLTLNYILISLLECFLWSPSLTLSIAQMLKAAITCALGHFAVFENVTFRNEHSFAWHTRTCYFTVNKFTVRNYNTFTRDASTGNAVFCFFNFCCFCFIVGNIWLVCWFLLRGIFTVFWRFLRKLPGRYWRTRIWCGRKLTSEKILMNWLSTNIKYTFIIYVQWYPYTWDYSKVNTLLI